MFYYNRYTLTTALEIAEEKFCLSELSESLEIPGLI